MPYIAGMSLGSWILIIVIAFWAFVAIKCYFFGGFKKKPKGQKTKVHVGAGCCGGGAGDDLPTTKKTSSCCEDTAQSACEHCASQNGCNSAATKKNAVMPIIKPVE